MFHAWFNEGKKPLPAVSENATISEKLNVPAQTPSNQQQNTLPEPAKSSDTSMVEEIFGMFGFKPHGEDYEEIAFARRMRKKKKRKI